jgi:hypothetical protein
MQKHILQNDLLKNIILIKFINMILISFTKKIIQIILTIL